MKIFNKDLSYNKTFLNKISESTLFNKGKTYSVDDLKELKLYKILELALKNRAYTFEDVFVSDEITDNTFNLLRSNLRKYVKKIR